MIVGSAEVIAAVGVATGAVGVLEQIAPVGGLGIVYLLAVLFIAFRRGEIAALATAVLSVLTFNFFFIQPRHRLTISDSRNVVALGVLLIAGILVSRLAAAARQRASESEARAELAAARDRESSLIARVASLLLSDGPARQALEPSPGLRIDLASVPSPREGEAAVPLRFRSHNGWVYASAASEWSKEDLERIAEPLARLVDVALERENVREQTAEAEAARRADTAKTAVLHAISHDLRSPLTAITTATSALGDGTLSADDRDELLAVLGDETRRLARLVDDLLDLSRIEAGAVNPQTDWCDLEDTVRSAAAQASAKHVDREVEISLGGGLPLVRADTVQMERVFLNLIDNALKFSPSDEPVRVVGSTAGGRVMVRVSDRGRGIPPSDRAHVFEPFYRGRRDRSGSGLGLTICRGFAQANGADIRLQSRRGEGTSFVVTFALVRQPATTA